MISKYAKIVSSKNTANAYKTFWKNGKYYEEKIAKENEFKSLTQLFLK